MSPELFMELLTSKGVLTPQNGDGHHIRYPDRTVTSGVSSRCLKEAQEIWEALEGPEELPRWLASHPEPLFYQDPGDQSNKEEDLVSFAAQLYLENHSS